MGARNLTMVINQEGEKKVAQYGQWDGYPSGVGIGILKILKDKELFERLVSNLSKTRFIDYDGIDKELVENYNKNAPEWSNEPDNRTAEQKRLFKTYWSRDLSEEILINIANSNDDEILVWDRELTAKGKDSWVEFSYVINLKENTFEVYGTLDCPAIKVYNLDNLPENEVFISDFETNDD